MSEYVTALADSRETVYVYSLSLNKLYFLYYQLVQAGTWYREKAFLIQKEFPSFKMIFLYQQIPG